jgi:hypothetical protein
MALSTTVFKVPDWAAQGVAMEAQAAQKRKEESEKRQKFTDAMGIDRQFAENQYKIVGKYKDATQAAFDAYKQAAIDFETSGSQEAKSRLESSRNQFNQAFGIGLSASAAATDEVNKMNASKGVGYIDTPDSAKQKYSEFSTSRLPTKIENGIVMVQEPDGAMVPLSQSVYFQQEQNKFNSFSLDRVDPNIKFLDPMALAMQDAKNIYTLSGVRVDGPTSTTYNSAAAVEKGLAQLRARTASDPEVLNMVATRWYAKTNNLDRNRLGFTDSAAIQQLIKNDPAFMEAAQKDFETAYSEGIKSQRPASAIGAATGGDKKPTQAELEASGVLRTATIGTQNARDGKKVYGGSFSLSNKPIKLTGTDDLFISDITMDSKGTIINYKLFKSTSSGAIDNWADAKKEEIPKALINKSQMQGLKSELISRGIYDNMRAQAGTARPNAAGLSATLGLE